MPVGWHQLVRKDLARISLSPPLDAENGRITMELISNIAVQPDRAVIVVPHDSRVYSFANQIANMEDARTKSVEAGPLLTGTTGRSARSQGGRAHRRSVRGTGGAGAS